MSTKRYGLAGGWQKDRESNIKVWLVDKEFKITKFIKVTLNKSISSSFKSSKFLSVASIEWILLIIIIINVGDILDICFQIISIVWVV